MDIFYGCQNKVSMSEISMLRMLDVYTKLIMQKLYPYRSLSSITSVFHIVLSNNCLMLIKKEFPVTKHPVF